MNSYGVEPHRALDPVSIEKWRLRYMNTNDEHLKYLAHSMPPIETSAAPNADTALRQVMSEKGLSPMSYSEQRKYAATHFNH